jgi:hypothetical protein
MAIVDFIENISAQIRRGADHMDGAGANGAARPGGSLDDRGFYGRNTATSASEPSAMRTTHLVRSYDPLRRLVARTDDTSRR